MGGENRILIWLFWSFTIELIDWYSALGGLLCMPVCCIASWVGFWCSLFLWYSCHCVVDSFVFELLRRQARCCCWIDTNDLFIQNSERFNMQTTLLQRRARARSTIQKRIDTWRIAITTKLYSTLKKSNYIAAYRAQRHNSSPIGRLISSALSYYFSHNFT